MYSDDGLLGSDAIWFGRYLSMFQKNCSSIDPITLRRDPKRHNLNV